MDKEMAQFQDDLLASVKQMKVGQAVRVTETVLSPARQYATLLDFLKYNLLNSWAFLWEPYNNGNKADAHHRVRQKYCYMLQKSTLNYCLKWLRD